MLSGFLDFLRLLVLSSLLSAPALASGPMVELLEAFLIREQAIHLKLDIRIAEIAGCFHLEA